MHDPAAAEMALKKAQSIVDNAGAWSLPTPALTPIDGGQLVTWMTDQGRRVEIQVMDNGLLFMSDSAAWDPTPQWVSFHVNRLLATVYAVVTDTNAKSRGDAINS